jgi:hypothetical protein
MIIQLITEPHPTLLLGGDNDFLCAIKLCSVYLKKQILQTIYLFFPLKQLSHPAVWPLSQSPIP